MSCWLDSLHLLRPHWLWALLALPALWALWRMRWRNDNVWKGVVDAHLLPHLLEQGGKAVRGALWMGALGYVITILALAGPSWRQSEQPLWQSHSPLVIALDLSSSIAASDLPPSRLLQARAKLATLLRERAGGQVALVVYTGEAFTVAPLTDDAANVALFLDALEPEVMPVDGQQPGKAIAWSVRLLQQAGFERGDIVLISDHADTAANGAAAEALRQGYRVSALGLGTAAGAPYRTAEGRIAQARLQAGTLRALSAVGGGRYQAVTADDSDLRALELLMPRETDASAARGKKGLAWQDEGYWLLPPLMLLALFAFRRGGAFAAVALCLCLPLAMSTTAQAAENKWWQRTDQQEHARIERGADAYRKGDYSAAEQAFTGIDSADAWYNQANALAKQGKYDEAIAAYDQALKRQPKMEDAIENRKVVDAARKRKPQGGQNQNQNQDQGKQKDQQQKSGQAGDGKTEPKQQPSDAKDKAGNPQQTLPKTGAGKTPEQPRTPQQQAADAKAQQAADAAQRQRMQQAMAQAGKQSAQADKSGAQVARATETPEQRERRQAIEAWLRRVPDEPGGLLKTKFQLEYERRQKEGQ
ncbi:tetratricopeptide repeat protein [Pseudoxanthomonas sp. CF125]|uniref:tetratricopeptide repeat protein n=1 Tax=Pseudoxanthomonas sp. CF125 TaxID=1855303 RepID=UPI00088E196E|nr:tetratricopeptide repeat protein [Pseudoxanthomonas sp. CF125]SDQ57760.1 Ca-activated chloride channel family protein [Pseudoxanthomonas sp. CF125]